MVASRVRSVKGLRTSPTTPTPRDLHGDVTGDQQRGHLPAVHDQAGRFQSVGAAKLDVQKRQVWPVLRHQGQRFVGIGGDAADFMAGSGQDRLHVERDQQLILGYDETHSTQRNSLLNFERLVISLSLTTGNARDQLSVLPKIC